MISLFNSSLLKVEFFNLDSPIFQKCGMGQFPFLHKTFPLPCVFLFSALPLFHRDLQHLWFHQTQLRPGPTIHLQITAAMCWVRWRCWHGLLRKVLKTPFGSVFLGSQLGGFFPAMVYLRIWLYSGCSEKSKEKSYLFIDLYSKETVDTLCHLVLHPAEQHHPTDCGNMSNQWEGGLFFQLGKLTFHVLWKWSVYQ